MVPHPTTECPFVLDQPPEVCFEETTMRMQPVTEWLQEAFPPDDFEEITSQSTADGNQLDVACNGFRKTS